MIDIASLHESFGRIVQTVCLCALPVALWACGVIWLHEHGIYLFRQFRGMFKSLHGVLAAIAIAALVAWAGTKPNLNPPSPQGFNPGMQQLQQLGLPRPGQLWEQSQLEQEWQELHWQQG